MPALEPTTPFELQSWIDRQLSLLSTEYQSEVAEAAVLTSKCSPALLERLGLALNGLGVAHLSTGLGGKTLVELERPSAYHVDPAFPPHGLRTGDLVRVLEHAAVKASKKAKAGEEKSEGCDGVVFKVSETKIVVAVGRNESADDDFDLPERCRLVKLANDATFKRMESVLTSLAKSLQPSPTSPIVSPDNTLISTLLGFTQPRFDQTKREEPTWLDAALNDSQREAARFVLQEALDVGLIHGPPGTGKTQTLCEVIRQLVKEGKRVLVCGASNLAVDNLVERLALHQVRITRIGHPARVLDSLHHVTLDSQISHSSAGQVVEDIKKEMNVIVSEIRKGKMRGKERREKWAAHRELRKELRKREGTVVSNVVSQVPVVLATTHGAGGRQLHGQPFDVVLIDEAAQALEASCWIPILKGRKLILAGDPLQLPPTVKSTAPELDNKLKSASGRLSPPSSLSVTLFERLLSSHGPRLKRLLTVQYRMNEKIMRFASDELYEGKLTAAEGVKERTLQDLTEKEDEILLEPLVFYDTAGADMYERVDAENSLSAESKSNENEATLVLRHVKELVSLGIDPLDIAIISPYQAQVSLLALHLRPLYPDMQIGTVDGFQGREAEVVCVSLVRSNDKNEVGFLSDSRRLNVAMTRPRRQLVVFGDSETVSAGTPYLKRWMAHLEEHADVRLAGMLDL